MRWLMDFRGDISPFTLTTRCHGKLYLFELEWSIRANLPGTAVVACRGGDYTVCCNLAVRDFSDNRYNLLGKRLHYLLSLS